MVAALILGLSLQIDKAGEYWFVGPDYRQARAEFTYMLNAFRVLGMVVGEPSMPLAETSPWSFEITGGTIFKTRTSSDISKLASFTVNGAVICEANQQEEMVFLKLMGRASQTKGCVILSGTIEKGLPWYIRMYKRWQGENVLGAKSWSLPTWSNIDVYPGGRQNPELMQLEATYPPDLFMERFGAEPRKTEGVVIRAFDIAKHVRRLVADPKLPVELWIDPGQHCYAIWFVQVWGLYTYCLDRIYARNRIVHDIIPEAMGNPLWKYINPQTAGVIDNAGKQHHANKSQVDLWREIAGIHLRSQYIMLDDTINTVNFRLGSNNVHHEPLVYFNDHMRSDVGADGMALDVLAEFDLWKWPERLHEAESNTPVKPVDRNNDAIKALGYGLVDHFGLYSERPALPEPTILPYWGVPSFL